MAPAEYDKVVGKAAATVPARSYWRWHRDDFFPEPSFASWGAYRRALGETPARLRDRLAGRSTDAAELGALRRRSEHEMRRCLTWWDLTWFGFGSVIGAGIFVLTGQEAHDHTGPAIVLSYVASGLSAMLSVFCYTEFVVEFAVETKNPSLDIPLGLLGSMSVITAIYCIMALVLSMMQPYTAIDRSAAYSVAFGSVGMRWAQYVVALGALKGMTTVLLVGALGQARYTTHIARSHIIPPVFALVHPRTGTPVHATALIAVCSACVALFSSLGVLSSLLSASTLFIFMMMATALLVRRYYVRGVTTRTHALRFTALLLLIIASSIGIAAYWGTSPERWQGYVVLVPAWAAGTLGIQLLVPAARAPKVWGVPLVPWLPSLSIATNLFLMGSLGKDAFIRFSACTAVMLVYYVLVGLHATYDVAHGACGGEDDDGDAPADEEKKVVAAADVEKADAAGGAL